MGGVVLNTVLAVRRSPRKGEKKPIYVLNLVIPTRHIDNCLEPAKSIVQIEVGKIPVHDWPPGDLNLTNTAQKRCHNFPLFRDRFIFDSK